MTLKRSLAGCDPQSVFRGYTSLEVSCLIQISEILEEIRTYAPDADLQPVMDAYLLSARAHSGQIRKSGEPYLSHPLAVAMILAEMRMDVDTIATALLHDALEDNPITKAEMEAQIGPVVTGLVDGVTKIGKLKFRSKEELALSLIHI